MKLLQALRAQWPCSGDNMTPNERTELNRLHDQLAIMQRRGRKEAGRLAEGVARLLRELAYREKASIRGEWMSHALRFEAMSRSD